MVFCDKVDDVPVGTLGPRIENSEYFPAKTNVEFIRVVNASTVKMRVWERGNGETWACGTGAAAAAIAAVLNGRCKADTDITVKLKGGDLFVRYNSENGHVTLTGNVEKIYEGTVEFWWLAPHFMRRAPFRPVKNRNGGPILSSISRALLCS